MGSPHTSVILPTCDRPDLLPRAVASVLAQGAADFELLIVDNNRRCPPVAKQPCSAAWARDERIRVLRPAGVHNAASARNAGLATARGEWVSYLDDDDAWRPETLARQLELAHASGAPLVLCGAMFQLEGRRRQVQCETREWRGDDLILRARWNTPLLLHRRGSERFDEQLSPGEDAELAHRIIAAAGGESVPNVPRPLVDIHPQPGARVNTNAAPLRVTAARILALRPGFYSRAARRRYVLHMLLAMAKLGHRPGQCLAIGGRLLWESGGRDGRAVANALAASLNLLPGRWVS